MSQSYENTPETMVAILSKAQDLRRAHLPWGEQSDTHIEDVVAHIEMETAVEETVAALCHQPPAKSA
jgi:hypothetical protein